MFSSMLRRHFVAGLIEGEGRVYLPLILEALFSDDPDDLDEAVMYAGKTPGLDDDFQEGVEGLKQFRLRFNEKREEMSPTERDIMERYDDVLTMDLVNQLRNGSGLEYIAEEDFRPEPEVA